MTNESESPLVGVGVVIQGDAGILLVRRGKDPGRGLWAVPGGKVDLGEEMKVAARREVAEETGLEVEVGDVVWVGEVIEGGYHIVLIDFSGVVSGGDLRPGDDAEEVRWVSFEEASDLPLTETMYQLLDTLRP